MLLNTSKIYNKNRPYCPIICATAEKHVAYDLALYRGLFPLVFETFQDLETIVSVTAEFMLQYDILTLESEFVLLNCLNVNEMRIIHAGKLFSDPE